jgi:hypothetical protein
LLRPTGNRRGEFQRVASVTISYWDTWNILDTPENFEPVTEEFYETFDEESGNCTFTII